MSEFVLLFYGVSITMLLLVSTVVWVMVSIFVYWSVGGTVGDKLLVYWCSCWFHSVHGIGIVSGVSVMVLVTVLAQPYCWYLASFVSVGNLALE